MQRHTTTSGWNWDVWLHNELFELTAHARTQSRDTHSCRAPRNNIQS